MSIRQYAQAVWSLANGKNELVAYFEASFIKNLCRNKYMVVFLYNHKKKIIKEACLL